MDAHELERMVSEKLAEVTDPGTGLDVLSMGMVKDLAIGPEGTVRLLFVPSSPACPLAFRIAIDIRDAVRSVPGVTGAKIDVEGHWRGEELQRVLEES